MKREGRGRQGHPGQLMGCLSGCVLLSWLLHPTASRRACELGQVLKMEEESNERKLYTEAPIFKAPMLLRHEDKGQEVIWQGIKSSRRRPDCPGKILGRQ